MLLVMPQNFIFSSESVGEGHPDKIADYISDTVLDACLEQDSQSRVACETLVKSNCVYLAGEVTTRATLDYDQLVRQAIRDIGYTFKEDVFHADKVFIQTAMTRQTPDIAQGVDARAAEGKKTAEQGAGDQGIMFGFACDDTEELMPAPIMYAHYLTRELARQRREKGVEWLRPDCKTQVAVEFHDGKAVALKNIVISTQHTAEMSHKDIEAFCIDEIARKVLPRNLFTKETEYYINPTGTFVVGGPESDAGLTGRKIIVDTYGGWARHGGGAFSGKDPSKVDRSAAYMCRWVAKNIVAARLAHKVELQVAYAIGYPDPTSIYVNTYGTGYYSDDDIIDAVKEVFSFKPADITNQLDLLHPIYRKTTHYGHFTKQDLPWEQTNKVEELRDALNGNGATRSSSAGSKKTAHEASSSSKNRIALS
tara:strand:+ start:1968 stop:3236 length:1269 start_codon:yes stop_codon:yes gene_type:complete